MRGIWGILIVGACGGSRSDDILALEGDSIAGEQVYLDRCSACHGVDGAGGSGPSLYGAFVATDDLVEVVLNGTGGMSGFDAVLDDQQIADVAAYVTTTFDDTEPTDACRGTSADVTSSPCGR